MPHHARAERVWGDHWRVVTFYCSNPFTPLMIEALHLKPQPTGGLDGASAKQLVAKIDKAMDAQRGK